MHGFARTTKLNNIGGRANYITDSKKQEEIVCKSEPVDWSPYQEYERTHRKSDQANNEGREVVVSLPNEWSKMDPQELEWQAHRLAVVAAGKENDMQWAVHWNKNRTNLHMHVIFSERSRDFNPGKWDRTIYQNKDGGVARRKADRAVDGNGNFIVLHKKGDLKDGFTAKDPAYVKRSWIPTMKEQLKQELQSMGVILEKPNPLHEYHEGKGDMAVVTRAKNDIIRANNAEIKRLMEHHPLSEQLYEAVRKHAYMAVKERQVLQLDVKNDQLLITQISYADHSKAKELRDLVDRFEVNSSKYEDLSGKMDRCHFYQIKKKQQLLAERELIVLDNKAILARAEELGVKFSNSLKADQLIKDIQDHAAQLLHPTPKPVQKHKTEKEKTRQTMKEWEKRIDRSKEMVPHHTEKPEKKRKSKSLEK